MPFFFALGALGGGLFVASPCVMGVVVTRRLSARAVCGYVRRRAEALRDGQRGPAARRGGGVCVWAGASGAAVCGNVRRRGVFVCQRAGGLRRRAPCVLRAGASPRAAVSQRFGRQSAGRITRSARRAAPKKHNHKCERRCEQYQNGRHVSVVRLSSRAAVLRLFVLQPLY